MVLWPPKTKVMSDLMLAGFMDMTRFLSYYGVTDRPLSCLTVESHLQKSQKPVVEVRLNQMLRNIVVNIVLLLMSTRYCGLISKFLS